MFNKTKKFHINSPIKTISRISNKINAEQNTSTVGYENNMRDTKLSSPLPEIIEKEPLTWKFWRKRRYVLVFLAFFGFFNAYALRINLSVGIVAMTENRTILHENGTISYEQDFNWNSKEQGVILSSFFYGYIITFLMSFIGSKIGGNLLFAVGIGVTAIFTILTPWAATAGIGYLITVRIIQGIFEAATFPCIQEVWARWAPPLERSRMAAISYAGTYAGTVVALPGSSLLATKYGWQSIFYVFGTFGCIWFIIWILIIKENPEKDRWITNDELNYIQKTIKANNNDVDDDPNHSNEKFQHPWKEIFTSIPVYAICVAHFAENWGFYTLLTQLPTFLKDCLQFDLGKVGFLSAAPYLAMGSMLCVAGYLADWLQIKGYLTTGQVRRIFTCIAFIGQTTFMMTAAYIMEPVGSVVSIVIAVAFGAFAWCGFLVNHLDIAPKSANILMGITNTFGTIPGIVTPTLTGHLVQNKTADEWKLVFYITSIIYLVGCVIYGFFGSGEIQYWAKPDYKKRKISLTIRTTTTVTDTTTTNANNNNEINSK